MQRYFATTILDNHVLLLREDAHHLVDVVRTSVGEKIEIVSGESVYLAEVKSLKPLDIVLLSPIAEKRELDDRVLLAFALLKGDHNDLIVEKGTELGVSSFLPFLCERTIIKVPEGSEDGRLLRLRKIAQSSAQQCRRSLVPTVESYASFQAILSQPADVKLFAYESLAGESRTLTSVLSKNTKPSRVLLVVGPEGGFTPEEAQEAQKAGFTAVSLGRRILRAETAAITCASLAAAFGERD